LQPFCDPEVRAVKLHVEPIYGFYHGQDPRTFSPDGESCSAKEIEAHKLACLAAHKGEWARDDSGCHVTRGAIVCKSSFGIGVYHVVMDEDGDYVRDATFDDYNRDGEWEEDVDA
jgi:hypothetical protein